MKSEDRKYLLRLFNSSYKTEKSNIKIIDKNFEIELKPYEFSNFIFDGENFEVISI